MQLKTSFFMLLSLVIGTTITLSSNHWFMAWMGLEINTLAIIPFIISTKNPRATEATTKYFLTQAAASITLMCLITFNFWKTGEWSINLTDPTTTTFILITLMMKLGIAPLHFWMPDVLQGTPLKTGLILATWQKLAPLLILFQLSTTLNTNIITTLGVLSILIGGWGIINQTELRKMLAYSSIGHLGWTIIILPLYPNIALLNFIIYIMMSIVMFMIFHKMSLTKISDLSTSWSYSPTMMYIMMMTMLSLSGLLPLTGFLPKLMIVWYTLKKSMIIVATMLLITSLLSTYMYIRLTHFMMMLLTPHIVNSPISWRPKKTINSFIPLLATTSILLMPVLPTIITLIN
uniref:NADH-ubiquinone oxidoreductase chain 2 n=1 Tax=Hyperolius marmoratus TaxID=476017 RepID=W0TJD2_HYPMR|nr:NADH dehydrogenase subunit 2 [Hyperolius marmoratus]